MPFNIVTIFAAVVLWLCEKCKRKITKAFKAREKVPENETDGESLKRETNEDDENVQEEQFDEVSLLF